MAQHYPHHGSRSVRRRRRLFFWVASCAQCGAPRRRGTHWCRWCGEEVVQ